MTDDSPVAIIFDTSGNSARLGPNFSFRVQQEPSELFKDKFNGSSLDTNKWATATGGTGAVTVSGGTLSLTTGTTASNYAAVTSSPSFEQAANVFIHYGSAYQFESGSTLINNTHRFTGLGTVGSNTTANPLNDAVGLEVDTTGNINACIFANGTKIFSMTLTTYVAQGSTALNDGNPHRVDIFYNTTKVWWVIDGEDRPAASVLNKGPINQTLPVRLHLINGTTPPVTAPTFILNGIGVADTGHNNLAISDGTYPWRKVAIDAKGNLQTKIVSTTPTNTTLTSSTSNQVVLAANTLRLGATVFNNSTATMLLKLGTTASTTSYTVQILSNGYYEVPFGYVGEIDAVWQSANGNALICELT